MKQLCALGLTWCVLVSAQVANVEVADPHAQESSNFEFHKQMNKITDPLAAVEPASTDAIQYVSQRGNDTDDGLSWGTAKLTIAAALEALHGGSSSFPCGGWWHRFL